MCQPISSQFFLPQKYFAQFTIVIKKGQTKEFPFFYYNLCPKRMLHLLQEGGNQVPPLETCLPSCSLQSISMTSNLTKNSLRSSSSSSQVTSVTDVPMLHTNSSEERSPVDCTSMLRLSCDGIIGCESYRWSEHVDNPTRGLKEALSERSKWKESVTGQVQSPTVQRTIHVWPDLLETFQNQRERVLTSQQLTCPSCTRGSNASSIRSLSPTYSYPSSGGRVPFSGYGKMTVVSGKRCYYGISWSTTGRSYYKELQGIVKRSRLSVQRTSTCSVSQDRPKIQICPLSKILKTGSI